MALSLDLKHVSRSFQTLYAKAVWARLGHEEIGYAPDKRTLTGRRTDRLITLRELADAWSSHFSQNLCVSSPCDGFVEIFVHQSQFFWSFRHKSGKHFELIMSFQEVYLAYMKRCVIKNAFVLHFNLFLRFSKRPEDLRLFQSFVPHWNLLNATKT